MHKKLSVKSRVRGDFHAWFCERVKLPRSTRPMPAMENSVISWGIMRKDRLINTKYNIVFLEFVH